jgi:hypothetical protein
LPEDLKLNTSGRRIILLKNWSIIPLPFGGRKIIMDKCHYCRRSKVAGEKLVVHRIGCPQVIPAYKTEYHNGWDDGYSGKLDPLSDHVAYMMGFGQGKCALEEFENGDRPY